jgi:hypothetical protein
MVFDPRISESGRIPEAFCTGKISFRTLFSDSEPGRSAGGTGKIAAGQIAFPSAGRNFIPPENIRGCTAGKKKAGFPPAFFSVRE